MPNDRNGQSMNNLRQMLETVTIGWPTIAKSVRDTDGARVADCKEEIDTLLVFAGLYSAILTAFVIESYKSLRQDPQDVMMFFLQRIAEQDNATSGPLPPFDTPQWAIRVNILWFTSVILSLAAASLGMLVKQWLREYLDFSTRWRSPRQQILARQFRYDALRSARVFEIAAVLPLLLQTSLGLFFVGLCFFTQAVHSSIGRTTLPVVAAWAFCFTLTIIAPVFSPRCPYKTTFLSKPIRACRRFIAPLIRPRWHLFLQYLGYKDPIVVSGTKERHWSEKLCEEDVFVNASKEDAEVLLAVDFAESDDGLLPGMFDILEQVDSPDRLVQFVIALLNRRLERLPGCGALAQPLSYVPDLTLVPRQAWQACTESLALLLIQHSRHLPKDSACPSWTVDAAIILLAQSHYELSEAAAEGLKMFFSPKSDSKWCPDYGTALAMHLREGGAPLAPLWKPLRSLCAAKGHILCTTCVLDVYVKMLCHDPTHKHERLLHLLRAHRNDSLFVTTNRRILDDLADTIVDWMSYAVPQNKHVVSAVAELLDIMVKLCDRLPRRDDLVYVYKLFWNSSFWKQVFARSFGAVDPHYRAYDHDMIVSVLTETWRACTAEVQDGMLANISKYFEQDSEGKFDATDTFVPTNAVRLCLVYLQIQKNVSAFWVDKEGVKLWKFCAAAIKRYHSTIGWDVKWKGWNRKIWEDETYTAKSLEQLVREDKEMAAQCLAIISEYDAVLALRGAGKDTLPDELLDTLGVFVDPQDVFEYPRLQQARDNVAAVQAKVKAESK